MSLEFLRSLATRALHEWRPVLFWCLAARMKSMENMEQLVCLAEELPVTHCPKHCSDSFAPFSIQGLVEALPLSNEALTLQLAPQSGRTQVVFSMFVLSKNTHQNDPTIYYVYISLRDFHIQHIYVFFWYLLGLGATLLICSEVRQLGWRPAKSVGPKPGTTRDSNEIRKSKMWTNAKKSMIQDVQKCHSMSSAASCWPLGRSPDRWVNYGCRLQIQIMAGSEGGALLSQRPQGLEISFKACTVGVRKFYFHKSIRHSFFESVGLMQTFMISVSFWWSVQFHIPFLFVWGCCSISWFLTRGSRRAGGRSFAVCCFPRFSISASETDMFQGPTTRLATRLVRQRSPELQTCCSPYIHWFLSDYCHSRSVTFWVCRRWLPKGSSQISRLGPY